MEKKLNILAIDDEQIVLDSIKKHLRNENFEVHTVLTPEAGLEKIRNNGIDFVLTDLMMPNMDGLELMQEIRKTHINMPIIMITGYATINTAMQAMQLGAFDYIAKPFSRAELKSVVKRAAERVQTILTNQETESEPEAVSSDSPQKTGILQTIGEHTWMMLEKSGYVLLGIEHPFLNTIGRIQTIQMPAEGDVLRQGSILIQFFTNDLCSHSILVPLSGEVMEVNQKVLDDPAATLEDPYNEGWLIRLAPSRFEEEVKLLGL